MDTSRVYISKPQVVVSQDWASTTMVSEMSGYTPAGSFQNYLVSFVAEPVGDRVCLEDVRVFGFDGSIKTFTNTPAGDTIGECLVYIASKI